MGDESECVFSACWSNNECASDPANRSSADHSTDVHPSLLTVAHILVRVFGVVVRRDQWILENQTLQKLRHGGRIEGHWEQKGPQLIQWET